MVAIPILSVQWIFFGYSLAFGPTHHGLIGRLAYVGMERRTSPTCAVPCPAIVFMACQMMFAVIAPALISGALGARMKLGAFVAFVLFWSTLVYDPVAHWLWGHGGWLSRIGALDFGGGIVVHFTTGISAVVCAVVMATGAADADGRRLARDVVTALAGAAVLWFGWFALNAGSALASGNVVGHLVRLDAARSGGRRAWAGWSWSGPSAGDRRRSASRPAWSRGSWPRRRRPATSRPSAAIAIGFIAGAIGYGTGLGRRDGRGRRAARDHGGRGARRARHRRS